MAHSHSKARVFDLGRSNSVFRLLAVFASALVFVALASADDLPAKEKPKLREPTATPAESLRIAKDFKVELLYSVPKGTQGSWVNMCVDPKGRLIVSDQYGPLYRITPPVVGGKTDETRVEKLDLHLGGAHGLLWAFDSLY